MIDGEVRARDAQQLLDNPLFSEAIDSLKDKAITSWLTSRDPVERERLWMWTNQAIALRSYFQAIVDNARIDASRVTKAPLP